MNILDTAGTPGPLDGPRQTMTDLERLLQRMKRESTAYRILVNGSYEVHMPGSLWPDLLQAAELPIEPDDNSDLSAARAEIERLTAELRAANNELEDHAKMAIFASESAVVAAMESVTEALFGEGRFFDEAEAVTEIRRLQACERSEN